jgi:hypothetical protein
MPVWCPQRGELRQHGSRNGKQAHKADQAQERQGLQGGRLVARPPPVVFVIHVLGYRRLLNVIANAGISIDKDNSSHDEFSLIRRTLDVDVGGVPITVEPLLARMIARKHGQRAGVSWRKVQRNGNIFGSVTHLYTSRISSWSRSTASTGVDLSTQNSNCSMSSRCRLLVSGASAPPHFGRAESVRGPAQHAPAKSASEHLVELGAIPRSSPPIIGDLL